MTDGIARLREAAENPEIAGEWRVTAGTYRFQPAVLIGASRQRGWRWRLLVAWLLGRASDDIARSSRGEDA